MGVIAHQAMQCTTALEHKGILITSTYPKDVDELWMVARTNMTHLSQIWKEKQQCGCEYASDIEAMLREIKPKLYVGALIPKVMN